MFSCYISRRFGKWLILHQLTVHESVSAFFRCLIFLVHKFTSSVAWRALLFLHHVSSPRQHFFVLRGSWRKCNLRHAMQWRQQFQTKSISKHKRCLKYGQVRLILALHLAWGPSALGAISRPANEQDTQSEQIRLERTMILSICPVVTYLLLLDFWF